MAITGLTDQLARDECERRSPYYDCCGKYHECHCNPRGNLTIGIGHNLDAKPLSHAAVLWIQQDDIEDARQELYRALPWTVDLDEARRGVLINMCFNMGLDRLLGFHNFLRLVQAHSWPEAAKHGRDSLWHKQVGDRAERLMKQIETGVWQ